MPFHQCPVIAVADTVFTKAGGPGAVLRQIALAIVSAILVAIPLI